MLVPLVAFAPEDQPCHEARQPRTNESCHERSKDALKIEGRKLIGDALNLASEGVGVAGHAPHSIGGDPMKLAIADPPYPPIFSERFDVAGDGSRIVTRSRALRWYGDGSRGHNDPAPADFHPEANKWDDLGAHRQLMLDLIENYDGWAIATTPDGLGAYSPLPISARIMSWVRPNAMPGGSRLMSRWEPVIVFAPAARRARGTGMHVSDVLVAAAPRIGFAGAKPPEWTRWVLDSLGYAPGADTVTDVFPGSGSVEVAADGMLALGGAS